MKCYFDKSNSDKIESSNSGPKEKSVNPSDTRWMYDLSSSENNTRKRGRIDSEDTSLEIEDSAGYKRKKVSIANDNEMFVEGPYGTRYHAKSSDGLSYDVKDEQKKDFSQKFDYSVNKGCDQIQASHQKRFSSDKIDGFRKELESIPLLLNEEAMSQPEKSWTPTQLKIFIKEICDIYKPEVMKLNSKMLYSEESKKLWDYFVKKKRPTSQQEWQEIVEPCLHELNVSITSNIDTYCIIERILNLEKN
jgi:hypothetical protein